MLKVNDVMIRRDQMESIGAKRIQWNRGLFYEYYLAIDGMRDSRLSVVFDEHPWHPVLACLVLSSSVMPLEHIKTIEQFKTLYSLLTGKSWAGDK